MRELMFHMGLMAAALSCLALPGCFSQNSNDVHVEVTPLARYRNPTKSQNCGLEVLSAQPSQKYTTLAIVEGWAGEDESEQLMKALTDQACATGADALLVISRRGQNNPPHLYQPTPNEASEQSTSGANLDPGHYLHQEEHIPKIGEPGHSGYYIDAAAIAYDPAADHH